MKERSFLSASVFPSKILRDARLMSLLNDGIFQPRHVTLFPTNRCNLKCSFCCCRDREKADEMPLMDVQRLAVKLAGMGTKAVTVTGGGEPLCHPEINGILRILLSMGIEVGMATNGMLLGRLETQGLCWVRISCCDERKISGDMVNLYVKTVERFPEIDWAFSYVYGPRFDIDNLLLHLALAKRLNLTHVRVLPEIPEKPGSPSIQEVKTALAGRNDLVVYQERDRFVHGRNPCLHARLRPLIAADGSVYPCCSVQYAHDPAEMKLPQNMRLGHWTDLEKLTAPFDGSGCVRCYYDGYNELLEMLSSEVWHEKFI